jgi:hypothetical protein
MAPRRHVKAGFFQAPDLPLCLSGTGARNRYDWPINNYRQWRWTMPGRAVVMAHMTTLSDLAGQVFADVPDVASITGRDERTIRRSIEAGKIPGQKIGSRWVVPTAWLRQQAGVPEPSPDPGELADQVAEAVMARLARLLGGGGGGASDLQGTMPGMPRPSRLSGLV